MHKYSLLQGKQQSRDLTRETCSLLLLLLLLLLHGLHGQLDLLLLLPVRALLAAAGLTLAVLRLLVRLLPICRRLLRLALLVLFLVLGRSITRKVTHWSKGSLFHWKVRAKEVASWLRSPKHLCAEHAAMHGYVRELLRVLPDSRFCQTSIDRFAGTSVKPRIEAAMQAVFCRLHVLKSLGGVQCAHLLLLLVILSLLLL